MDASQKKETIQNLTVPFDASKIKQRPQGGRQVDYLEHATVIERLNEVLPLGWSFELIDKYMDDACVAVLARIKVGEQYFDQWGSNETTKGMSVGDRLKSASSDALKKCATMLGVGLHLYQSEDAPHGTTQQRGGGSRQNAPQGNNGRQNGNGASNTDTPTAGQTDLIKNLLKNPLITDDERTRTEAGMAKLTKRGASELIDRMKIKIDERKETAHAKV